MKIMRCGWLVSYFLLFLYSFLVLQLLFYQSKIWCNIFIECEAFQRICIWILIWCSSQFLAFRYFNISFSFFNIILMRFEKIWWDIKVCSWLYFISERVIGIALYNKPLPLKSIEQLWFDELKRNDE